MTLHLYLSGIETMAGLKRLLPFWGWPRRRCQQGRRRGRRRRRRVCHSRRICCRRSRRCCRRRHRRRRRRNVPIFLLGYRVNLHLGVFASVS